MRIGEGDIEKGYGCDMLEDIDILGYFVILWEREAWRGLEWVRVFIKVLYSMEDYFLRFCV